MNKLFRINWLLPALVLIISVIGTFMIYAASGGDWSHGAQKHFIRALVAVAIMLAIAMIDIRVWYELAYPIYVVALLLLLAVDLYGVTVNGSERWIKIGPGRVQPSEFMKIAVILALSRYYHDLQNRRISHWSGVLIAVLIIAIPAQFVLRQPDLGTTLLIVITGITMIFLAGVNWRIIFGGVVSTIIAIPLFFKYGLKPYQQERIMTMLNPELDPRGAGYHISQSKIALGSGGTTGKGFMKGTQRQLSYVPENLTDFIFTVIGEEHGLRGCVATLLIYTGLIGLCLWISSNCRHFFTRLLVAGVAVNFMLYILVNIAMVVGIVPVVGVPLPFISYGGTVMLSLAVGFGLILSADVHNDVELPRSGRGYGLKG